MKQTTIYDFSNLPVPKNRFEYPSTDTTVEIVEVAGKGWDLVWKRGKETLRYHYKKLEKALKEFEEFKKYAKQNF